MNFDNTHCFHLFKLNKERTFKDQIFTKDHFKHLKILRVAFYLFILFALIIE